MRRGQGGGLAELQELREAPCEEGIWIFALPPPDAPCLRTVPHQYFWYHSTLRASKQVEEGLEMLVLHITLCLFVTWIILNVIMIIRIKISVLVSAPGPPPG